MPEWAVKEAGFDIGYPPSAPYRYSDRIRNSVVALMSFENFTSTCATLITAAEARGGVWHVTTIPQSLRALLEAVRPVFDYPEDLTCTDDGAKLQVLYRLYSLTEKQVLHITVAVPRSKAHLHTASDLWRGVDWHEREIFDMFGVVFDGHPDLRRILTWEGFDGHPLLKDFMVDNADSSWQIPEQTDNKIIELLVRE